MTTLVTGATGFVGSAVARHLAAAGAELRLLSRPDSDRRNLAGLAGDVVTGDLRDRGSLERALKGCSALFHVAADYRLWARRPQDLYDSNVTGTENIMAAAGEAGVGRIVYTSSVATLGRRADGRPAGEETPVRLGDMIGHYKRSKFLAEAAVRRLAGEDGLPVTIVNPSTPVGPRDIKPTPTGRLIVEAAAGRIPAFVETGLNIVHVDDVAAGHLLAHAHGAVGERYVLGGQDKTLGEILVQIAVMVGHRPPRIRLAHGLVLPIAYVAEAVAAVTGRAPFATVDGVRMARKPMFYSSAKAARELGYSFRPAEEAERDAVAWFRDNGYV